MRIPFRRRPVPAAPGPVPTAVPDLGPSRHAEIIAFRTPPVAKTCQALIDEHRYAEACELFANQASGSRQLIELGEKNNTPPAISLRPELDMRLAWALEQMGLMKLQLGRIDEAIEDNAEALLIYRRLTADDPWFGQFLAHCLLERAFALTRVPDFAEANSSVEEAIAIHRTVTRQVPDEWEGFGKGFPAVADSTRDLIIKEASRLGLKDQDGFEVPPGSEIATFANREEAIKVLRGYVMPPDKLTHGVAENAPEILPGLVLAVCTWRDEQLGFMPYYTMVQAFGDPMLVRQAALANLQNLDGIEIQKLILGDDEETETIVLGANDPFVASRCAVLPWLVHHMYGETARHGTLVSLPIRGGLQFHVIRGKASLLSATILAAAVHEQFRHSPEENRISPDVFMVAPDGRAQRVAYIDEHGNDVIDTSGLLGEALYGPPPNGLNLPR
jgi:hypothetical protein